MRWGIAFATSLFCFLTIFSVFAEQAPGSDNARHLTGRYPTVLDTRLSMVIQSSILIKAPPKDVAQFLMHLDRYFLEINPDNLRIEVVGGGDLTLGSEFMTEQKADERHVHSRFKIVEADGISRMTLVSDPSISVVDNQERITSTLSVYTIEAQEDGSSLLTQKITICFHSLIEQLGAKALGIKKTWQMHTESSLQQIARMIETGKR